MWWRLSCRVLLHLVEYRKASQGPAWGLMWGLWGQVLSVLVESGAGRPPKRPFKIFLEKTVSPTTILLPRHWGNFLSSRKTAITNM